jgi:hypothetical protein
MADADEEGDAAAAAGMPLARSDDALLRKIARLIGYGGGGGALSSIVVDAPACDD